MANPGVEIQVGTARRSPRPAGNTVIGLVGDATDVPSGGPAVGTITLITNIQAEAANHSLFGDQGSIPDAIEGIAANVSTDVIVVRVADRNPAFTTPSIANLTAGIQQLESAQSSVGEEPHIILCPDFTFNRGAANPYPPLDTVSTVVTQLQTTATALDAIAVVGTPPTSVALAKTWADNNRQGRVYAVYPHLYISPTRDSVDPSGYVAGALARGNVWDNPMWLDVRGAVRTARPLTFHPRNTSDDAASLQADNITALVSREGIHLWGATLLVAATNTGVDRFLNVLREIDDIDLQLDAVSEVAMRQNLVSGFADEVIQPMQQYLDSRVARRALNAGTITLDEEANTPSELSAGNVHFILDITPAIPAQRLIYRRFASTTGITV